MLTLVALKLLVQQRLPEISYNTILDYYFLVMLVFMLCELGSFAFVSDGSDTMAQNELDNTMFYALLVCFIAGHVGFGLIVLRISAMLRDLYPPLILAPGTTFDKTSKYLGLKDNAM